MSRSGRPVCGVSLARTLVALLGTLLVSAWLGGAASAQVDAQAGAQGSVSSDAQPAASADDETPPPVVMVGPQLRPLGAQEPAAVVSSVSSAAPEVTEQGPLPWDLLHRVYSTWDGDSGGMFVEDPAIGEPGALRLQLAIDGYSGESFLYDGDSVEQDRQQISASWSALRLLQVYGSLQNRATVSDTPSPNSIHTLGDMALGVKLGGEVGQIARLAGSIRLLAQSDLGDKGGLLDATSVGLEGSAAIDLQRLDEPVPFVARFNLEYVFDNSAKVIDEIESLRYDSLTDPASKKNETRNLVSRVERFGLGMNRIDVFTLGIGLEVPLELATDLYLHPMLEWRLGLPVNRQGYDCAYRSADAERGSRAEGAYDTCLDDAGLSAFPMTLALGVRVVPLVRGVSALIGADIGLTGTDTFVRELTPTAPVRVLFAIGYDYDAEPPPPPPMALREAAPPPPPPKGRVAGQVSDEATEQPVAGAVVRFVGRELSPVASDARGAFTSYELDPGPVPLELSHPDYETGQCSAAIAEQGGDVAVVCMLKPLPKTGSITLSVRDLVGRAVAGARVQLNGPTSVPLTTDPAGQAHAADLAAGDYTARIDTPSHLIRVVPLTVAVRQDTRAEAVLIARPAKSAVTAKGQELRVTGLAFNAGAAELANGAETGLVELADYLMRDPLARRVRISGDGGDTLALSRALAIKQALVDGGVPEARIDVATTATPKPTIVFIE